MEKKDIKFIKDYTTVLIYVKDNSKVAIEDVNDILLSDKYYKQYRTEMVNTPDYKEAFLKHFEKDFEDKLTEAKKLIVDKNKQKNKMKI